MARPDPGIRLLAALEATKGLAVLLAGTGLLLLVHRDLQAGAERLVHHLHLNPASRSPRIFLHLAAEMTNTRLQWLAFGAASYSGLRFAEAVGLWRERRWAEWLGAVSGGIYLPLELRSMVHHPGLEPAVAIAINLGVVAYLVTKLRGPGSRQ